MSDIRVISTEFTNEGENVSGSFVLPHEDGPHPGVCKFHGLPGSSNQVGGIATQLAGAGFAVLTFDFRGFRNSEGTFSLSNEISDARRSLDHMLESGYCSSDRIGVYAASFGAAVAVCASALDERIDSLCLRAPVYDTRKLVEGSLAKLILNEIRRFSPRDMHGIKDEEVITSIIESLEHDSRTCNPIDLISEIKAERLLIITGDEDPLIDVEGVRSLYERAQIPKKLEIIEGADHNLSSSRAYSETVDSILSWFKEITN